MYLYILFTLYLIYAIFITRLIRKQIAFFNKRFSLEDSTIAEKYDCFRRKDMSNWNHVEMYFCAIFLLPIRMVLFLSTLFLCALVVKLALIGVSLDKPLTLVRRTIIKSVTQFSARSALIIFGFYCVNVVKRSISDVDPSYPKDNTKVSAPVIISNHVSWLDIILQLSSDEAPGFMAKSAIAKYPIVGNIAKAIGCLFVERESQSGRDEVVQKLKERLESFKTAPEVTPKVLIFPEGTTSNGDYILSLKKGAFFQLTPVHITGIKYHATRFNPAFDSLGMGPGFLFTLCQLYSVATLYDLGVYNPEHLNLKSEEDWVIYAGKVKEILQKTLNIKSCQLGFADRCEYQNYLGTLMSSKSSKAKTA